MRYWAVDRTSRRSAPEAAPAVDALKKALDDPMSRRPVRGGRRAVPARLVRRGPARPGPRVCSDSREPVVLHAARTLQRFGDKAGPLIEQME